MQRALDLRDVLRLVNDRFNNRPLAQQHFGPVFSKHALRTLLFLTVKALDGQDAQTAILIVTIMPFPVSMGLRKMLIKLR